MTLSEILENFKKTAISLDKFDNLAHFRNQFVDNDAIYLDGNSLGTKILSKINGEIA
jgi:kynureninase